MRKYNDLHECPKCGYGAVSTKFESAFWPAKFGTGVMKRRCSRCGYSWEEAPLDISPSTEKAS